jgi:hypothetical protein
MADINEMAMVGGPAFPQEWREGYATKTIWHGISARDYFAAAAMTGMLSTCNGEASARLVASGAYEYADAMLAARERKGEGNG